MKRNTKLLAEKNRLLIWIFTTMLVKIGISMLKEGGEEVVGDVVVDVDVVRVEVVIQVLEVNHQLKLGALVEDLGDLEVLLQLTDPKSNWKMTWSFQLYDSGRRSAGIWVLYFWIPLPLSISSMMLLCIGLILALDRYF